MHLTFAPVRSDTAFSVERQGDALVIDGEVFDFSSLGEGDLLPSGAISGSYFVGDVRRVSGQIHATLRLPHGANAPDETRFPAPVIVTQNGPVSLPPFNEVETDD